MLWLKEIIKDTLPIIPTFENITGIVNVKAMSIVKPID